MPIPPAGPGSGPDLPELEPSVSETAPTLPFLPPRPSRPHLENLSPQERGVALPRGLSGTSRNLRITLIALGVLVLVGCCTLSWSAVSAIIPPPGAPVAAASGSPTASATASPTDQPSATDNGTPTSGDATPTDTPSGSVTPSPSASPTDTPTATPTAPTPTPTATPCPNPYCNPWGYNFIPGSVIYSPNLQFCSVFPCIDVQTFWSQSGFVVQCNDGHFAKDGNFQHIGICKKHSGYRQTLYQHP